MNHNEVQAVLATGRAETAAAIVDHLVQFVAVLDQAARALGEEAAVQREGDPEIIRGEILRRWAYEAFRRGDWRLGRVLDAQAEGLATMRGALGA